MNKKQAMLSVGRDKVSLWRSLRRRWMMAGVLAVVTLAVLAPRLGAHGGLLHTELSSCVPLCYVYYIWGRRTGSAGALWAGLRAHARLHAACVAHAHLVAPALAAALLTTLKDGVDYRIAKGVMVWSRGGGCAWLSLSLSTHSTAPGVAALLYAAALLVTPLATVLLCGRASLPPPLSVLSTLATTAAPFIAGTFRATNGCGEQTRALRLCALALLYTECCERLCESDGILYVWDVLITLMLEWCMVCGLAATSLLYAHCGVLTAEEARLVTLYTLPRSIDTRWEPAGGCISVGLVRLPGVFLAPAQALLLAAIVPDHTVDTDHYQRSQQSTRLEVPLPS